VRSRRTLGCFPLSSSKKRLEQSQLKKSNGSAGAAPSGRPPLHNCKWRRATRRSSPRKGISSSERQTVAASRPPFASARRICAAAASLSGKNWNPCWQTTTSNSSPSCRRNAQASPSRHSMSGPHSTRDGKHIRTDVYADHVYGVAKPLLRNACHYSGSASDV
jgi:hypothetical protein